MHSVTTEEKLQERIKELACLYSISSTILTVKPFDQTMNEVCRLLKQGWRYPDAAVIELSLNNQVFLSDALPEKTVYQNSPIIVNGRDAGFIKVHYDAQKYTEESFLVDEQLLLDKVAFDIGLYYERQISKEREVMLTRSAERTDRLSILGEITAGIAHELNTPLGNILGYAEFIHDNANEGQIRQDSAKVIKAAIYSREIVKKLMFFSCEMPQHMESIKIYPVIEQAITLLEPNLRRSDVTISLDCDNKELQAQLDNIQFTQVLFNLLMNAIYVSPKGGHIQVDVHDGGQQFYITVSDQGPGIPDAIRQRIFEPFFTTKPFGEGSGLGLSVVHGIIKSHRGEITTADNVPHGTVFKINLPIKLSK